MTLKIRFAERKDLLAVRHIYAPYVQETAVTFEYEVPSVSEFVRRYEKIAEQLPWLVCEDEGEIIGYSYAEVPFEREAYKWAAEITVYLDKRYHRRGIARAFYCCIEELLCIQGYYHLYACITKSNNSSILFHKNLHFEEVGLFPQIGYKLGEWHDVTWYRKQLQTCEKYPSSPISIHAIENEIIEKKMKKAEKTVNY